MNPFMMLLQQRINSDPRLKSNPMIQNAFQNSNNVPELESLAKNYCSQQGINLDEVKNYIQSNPFAILQLLGMK